MYLTRDDIIATNALELGMSKSKVCRAMDFLIMSDLADWTETIDGWEFRIRGLTKKESVLRRL